MYTHVPDSYFYGPSSRKALHQTLKLSPPSPRRAKKHHRGRQTLAYLARNGKLHAVATRRRTKHSKRTDAGTSPDMQSLQAGLKARPPAPIPAPKPTLPNIYIRPNGTPGRSWGTVSRLPRGIGISCSRRLSLEDDLHCSSFTVLGDGVSSAGVSGQGGTTGHPSSAHKATNSKPCQLQSIPNLFPGWQRPSIPRSSSQDKSWTVLNTTLSGNVRYGQPSSVFILFIM